MPKKMLDVRSFSEINYVSSPAFSEDAAYLSYIVKRADLDKNSYPGDLYLYNMNTKENRRMSGSGDIGGVKWTKEGTMLFAAMRDEADKKKAEDGEEFTVFYELRPDGGEALRAFTVPASGANILDFLEDGRLLVTYSFDETKPRLKKDGGTYAEKELSEALADHKKHRAELIEEFPFRFNGMGYVYGKKTVLALFDRVTGKLENITEKDIDVSGAVLRGDLIAYGAHTPVGNKSFAGKKNPVTVASKEAYFEGVFLYNIKTGKTKTLVPMYEKEISILDFLSDDELLVAYNDFFTNPLQHPSFYVLELKTGFLRPYLKESYEASLGSSVGSDARQGGGRSVLFRDGVFTFISTVGDTAVLRQLRGGEVIELSPTGKIFEVTDFFRVTDKYAVESFDLRENHLACCLMVGNAPAELYLDGKRITNLNREFNKTHVFSTPEPLTYTGTDGVEIHGWCMKPADLKPGKKYPAILHIHGGPATVFSPVLHLEMQLWAANGYFVFFCNPRGSDGRGNDFIDISGRYGSVEYDNLMEFTDRVLKAYPAIDAGKVGVTGGSYGGFMTNWIIGHTDRFACACSQRSIANWTTFEYTSDIGPVFTRMHHGPLTRENIEELWNHSPLKYAPSAVTPTLFVCGDEDYRCYQADSIAMFTCLQENGVPAKLAMFHGENHDLSRTGKPANRITRMQEILAWMDRFLKN